MDGVVWSSLSEGLHIIFFKAWDDLGNINDGPTPSWQFVKDFSAPQIIINSANDTYYNSVPTFDVDFIDIGGLDAAFYKVDSFTPTGIDSTGWIEIFTNYFDTSYTIDFSMNTSIWNSLSEGEHVVYFKSWDDLNNIKDGNLPQLTFNKDTSSPIIIINSPIGKGFDNPPTFSVSFEDSYDLDAAYYKIDSYIPMGLNITDWNPIFNDISGKVNTIDITIPSSVWNLIEEGSYTIYIKCWDDLKNVNDGPTPYWQFYKYFGTPIIKINNKDGLYFNNTPVFDVDFYDPTGLDAAYYKVDSCDPSGINASSWYVIFEDLNSKNFTASFQMENSVWVSLSEGSHVIYFKAWNYTKSINDGVDPHWQLYKDTIPPQITLISPAQNGIYQSSTTVNINVTGYTNFYYCWDDNPYVITSSTKINLPSQDGQHTLHIKAEDIGGNVKYAHYAFITDDTAPTAQIYGISDHVNFKGGALK